MALCLCGTRAKGLSSESCCDSSSRCPDLPALVDVPLTRIFFELEARIEIRALAALPQRHLTVSSRPSGACVAIERIFFRPQKRTPSEIQSV